MTGGTVVILGPVGSNFAAGMTGGIAYVLDEHGRFTLNLNGESVAVREFDPDKDHQCEALIRHHLAETGSPRAAALLDDWPSTQTYIRVVEPLEMIAYRQRQRDNEQALDTVTQSAANIA
ncbi:MAG: hypothetical protein AAFO78_13775, partial [Pseudomonadota bacterium]